ncbi:MAG: glucosaminidase domain-containing protein [Pseudomonadales bacterium]|jgi:Bax protein|nr:glucosaminidase domain-containing protein [Pseudomonadales bacterium]
MTDRHGPDTGPSVVGVWLRAHPEGLLAGLVISMALPLALLLVLAPRLEPEAEPEPEARPRDMVVPRPLPDFAAIDDLSRRKQAFFDYLLPLVEANNARVRGIRAELLELRGRIEQGAMIGSADWDRVAELAERYRVAIEDDTPLDVALIDRLLRRVDVLPASLVLAQAATESAWGTSRFARVANNLFGEWCFTEGCGIVPARRRAGATHEVEEFASIRDSVDSYFRNLNSHPAYRGVRERRLAARRAGEAIRGADLAAGLTRYSERGDAYVEELRAIMRFNDLAAHDVGAAVAPSVSGN